MDEIIVSENNLPIPADITPNVLAEMDNISRSAENVDKALKAAKKAKESADAASKRSAGWSITGKDKKEAIEALQKSGIELAAGIQDIADAQKTMFDNLLKITDATKYLFGLGIANIASTRAVIGQITSGLQDASKRNISQRAKDSLLDVVRQLKAQEDLFLKLEKLANRCKGLEKEVQAVIGSEGDQSDVQSLAGLGVRISEVHATLLTEISERAETISREALQKMEEAKAYSDTLLEKEVSRADNAYTAKCSSAIAQTHMESIAEKVITTSEKRLQDVKLALESKNSALKISLWILGFVSMFNLIASVMMFLR